VECGGEFWRCQRSGMDKSSVFRPNTTVTGHRIQGSRIQGFLMQSLTAGFGCNWKQS